MMFVPISYKKVILGFSFILHGREQTSPYLGEVFGSGHLLCVFLGVYKYVNILIIRL